MTIIKGIENMIDCKANDIKLAIKNNEPIEEKLNVILVISNPCLYARRYILLKEFVKRFELEEENVNLFIVEMVYGDQKYAVTDKNNTRHLQLKTDDPIWHKENMINLGVRYLLPADWKAFAWVDADVEFENNNWALDTLKILNGAKDVVQLFSHCVDMDRQGNNLNIFNGFGYCFNKNKTYTNKGSDYWHPGYAWAITRRAYEKVGGIYDKGVLGSGDSIMALSFIGKSANMNHPNYNKDYNNSMLNYQINASKLRLGYTPGVIRHHFHGSKENRRYTDRWQILMNNQYSPITHLQYDASGILVPSEEFSLNFKQDIFNYFLERKEDE